MQLTLPPLTPEATGTIVPTPDITIIPPPPPLPIDAIPAPKYDYKCVSSGVGTDKEIQCITPDMTFVQKVSHVMFMEGSISSVQLMVDMLQVVLNDDYYAWTCSIAGCTSLEYRAINPNKIPWSDITLDQFERLTLYILSQPYYPNKTNSGKAGLALSFPAWNGWAQPLPWGAINSIYPGKLHNYDYTEQAVQLMLDNCVGFDLISGDACISLTTQSGHVYFAQHPIRVVSVTYVYSTANHLLGCGAPVVAFDKIDAGNGNWQYVQFLTKSGISFDKKCQ